jgi:hypothetical protein
MRMTCACAGRGLRTTLIAGRAIILNGDDSLDCVSSRKIPLLKNVERPAQRFSAGGVGSDRRPWQDTKDAIPFCGRRHQGPPSRENRPFDAGALAARTEWPELSAYSIRTMLSLRFIQSSYPSRVRKTGQIVCNLKAGADFGRFCHAQKLAADLRVAMPCPGRLLARPTTGNYPRLRTRTAGGTPNRRFPVTYPDAAISRRMRRPQRQQCIRS